MTTKNLKNLLAAIGYVATLLCISATPQMVKWYMIMYVMYLVAVWMGHDHE